MKGLLDAQQMLPLSSVHPSSLCPAFSSFLFATVYHALNSQNDLPGTPFASGCSLDHKSQMTSHRQVQSPLHLPSRTLSYWLHLLSMLHLLLLRNTHLLVVGCHSCWHVPLCLASAVSPSWNALSGSPSLDVSLTTMWISLFSDF